VPVIRVDNLLFVSGQGPLDPVSNQFVLGSVQDQTRLVIENIQTILASCGATLKDVVKCSVYLESPDDFAAMNEAYAEYFSLEKPTRTTIASMLVVPGMKVEIDCIAYSPK
jgi:2-iminobutanoate/2-iminopropanoate deaminase